MRTIPALVLAFALCIGLLAAQARTQLISGVVVKVDQSAKRITLRHGPIPKLDMDEGMTMVFAAPDAAMLTAVKAGDKVKFDAESVN